jgi:hypothetical protein
LNLVGQAGEWVPVPHETPRPAGGSVLLVDHGDAARRLDMVYLAYGVSYMIAAVLHPVNGQARSIWPNSTGERTSVRVQSHRSQLVHGDTGNNQLLPATIRA